MLANDWIDRLKKTTGIETDYAAAKALGVSRQVISSYRSGDVKTISDELAVRIAELMKIDPMEILLDQAVERAPNSKLRKLWKDAAKSVAAVALCIGATALPDVAHGASETARTLYIMLKKAWRQLRQSACSMMNYDGVARLEFRHAFT